jgi:hypothetical protein
LQQTGLERVKGIEPSYLAWEASVLPLNYTRKGDHDYPKQDMERIILYHQNKKIAIFLSVNFSGGKEARKLV